MKCTVCGGMIPDGADVCPICGMTVAKTAAGSDDSKFFSFEDVESPEKPAESTAEEVKSTAEEAPKNKYSLVGGNAEKTNPFGADPKNIAARVAPVGMEQGDNPFDPAASPYNPGGAGYNPGGTGFNPAGPADSPYNTPAVPVKNSGSDNTVKIIAIVAMVAVVAVIVIFWLKGSGKANGTYNFYEATKGGMTLSVDTLKQYGYDLSSLSITIKGSTATLNLWGQSASAEVKVDGDKMSFISGGETIVAKYDSDAGTITMEQDGMTMTFKK